MFFAFYKLLHSIVSCWCFLTFLRCTYIHTANLQIGSIKVNHFLLLYLFQIRYTFIITYFKILVFYHPVVDLLFNCFKVLYLFYIIFRIKLIILFDCSITLF